MPAVDARATVRWEGDEPVVEVLWRVQIAAERCKGCALCVAVCPPHVLSLGALNAHGYPAAVLHDPEGCTSCTACALICPETAIVVRRPPRAARA